MAYGYANTGVIYKAGTQAVTNQATKGSLNANSTAAAAGNYPTYTVSPVTGKATYLGTNGANGTTVAVGTLSKNTPQS